MVNRANIGDSWKRMPAPSKDSNGNDYNCGSDCFLNLHAFTERKDHRDEYSSIGAVGLMVAAGNVGKTLSKFNDGNMYLSMNGGLSWKEVAKNGHMYEIIGHGGIIIMVNDEESVDYFLYSLDGGNTFLSMDIRKYTNGDNFRISNIISEPSGTTFHATLFGKLTNGDSVSIHLDFEKVYGRECVRYDDPVRSDFEYWALGNSSSVENCVFGAHVSFERRKPDRQCAVGELYQRLSTNFQVCECTYADFECDQYHTRDGNKCVPTPGITVPQGICENGLFHTPTGYVKRKISQCGGGLELDIDPNARPCSNSSFSWFWFFFTTVPIAGMVGYGVQSYRNGAWGRYGRIQLPVDTAEPVWETRTPFQRFMANSYNGVVNTADFLSKKAFSLYAFVQSRIRRSEGYEPVNTHYYDPDLPTPVANELVWDDESQ